MLCFFLHEESGENNQPPTVHCLSKITRFRIITSRHNAHSFVCSSGASPPAPPPHPPHPPLHPAPANLHLQSLPPNHQRHPSRPRLPPTSPRPRNRAPARQHLLAHLLPR